LIKVQPDVALLFGGLGHSIDSHHNSR
jgi:hypothetical protein